MRRSNDAEKLATSAGATARRNLKTQMRKVSRTMDEAVADAGNLRDLLRPVSDQLKSASEYMVHATGVDKLVARVESDWAKAGQKARAKRARARRDRSERDGRRAPPSQEKAGAPEEETREEAGMRGHAQESRGGDPSREEGRGTPPACSARPRCRKKRAR